MNAQILFFADMKPFFILSKIDFFLDYFEMRHYHFESRRITNEMKKVNICENGK